ncbi:organomercurial lyase [Streptomyces coeruleorubidus]|uniref:organomercurial lyase n=1 Tax=Streptomyces coeruleorubidus TaxID=116188 RepID=UPI0036AAC179
MPTPHRLRLASGVEAWAMCAIDALSVAAMLYQDVTVASCDLCDRWERRPCSHSGLHCPHASRRHALSLCDGVVASPASRVLRVWSSDSPDAHFDAVSYCLSIPRHS